MNQIPLKKGELLEKKELKQEKKLSNKQRITIESDRMKKHQQIHALAIILIPLLGSVIAAVLALHQGINSMEIGLLITMYALTMIGITVGYHRQFAHCSFQTNSVVRVMLAILGSMACQGPVIYWVSVHRCHHQYSDNLGDPHSPHLEQGKRDGLWQAHIGWMLGGKIINSTLFAKDLLRDSTIANINQLYFTWVILGLAIPSVLGAVISGTWIGCLQGLLWGGLVRIFLVHHATWSINSITHLYGNSPFNTSEQSKNNIWLAIPTGGEAWHNNHHAFPNSAILGLEWWQIDVGAWVIRLLEKTGLACQVKSPTKEMIEAKKLL